MMDYFSSYTNWHYALSGPENMDSANWGQWWLPSAVTLSSSVNDRNTMDSDDDDYFQFAISPDCSSCDLANNLKNNKYSLFSDDEVGDRTAYYMTGYVLSDYPALCT